MTGPYEYTPYIWWMLAPPAILLVPAAHAWRHRSVPGALPFVALMVSLLPWSAGAALQLAAASPAGKILWSEFQAVWQLPAATASLWFALEYANLDRWLTRPVVALLLALPAAAGVLVLTNASHGLVCRAFAPEAQIGCSSFGPVGLAMIGYGSVVAVAGSLVFAWVFVRSPLHRWPAALCLCGHAATRAGFLLELSDANPAAPLDATILGSTFTAAMYAVALLRFRMFELIPVAQGTVFRQMQEGVIVLDRLRRVVDLNPAAEAIVGLSARRARGAHARDVLPWLPDPGPIPGGPVAAPGVVAFGAGSSLRQYRPHLSPLEHRGGFHVGSLVVLHDVTPELRAEARSVEHERALATLQERDRVARELHDGLGQVLGYVKMQAQAARGLLAGRRVAEADALLAQLVSAAQDAHADVREFILGVRASDAQAPDFQASLEEYLRRFRANYGIVATLEIAPDLADRGLEPMAAAQLLRIIQEALTNVRKHAGVSAVRVALSVCDGRAQAVVADAGRGFDASRLAAADGSTFGLHFMRERAEAVGGGVRVVSSVGAGTRVIIGVPLGPRAS